MTTKIEDAVKVIEWLRAKAHELHADAGDTCGPKADHAIAYALDDLADNLSQQREAGAVAWVSVSDEIPAVMGWYLGYWLGRVEPMQWRGEYWHHTRPTRDVATPTHWCRLPKFAPHPAQAASQEGERVEPFGYGDEWSKDSAHPAADKVLVPRCERARIVGFWNHDCDECKRRSAAALSPPANGENDGR
jgi:hypothetical protein